MNTLVLIKQVPTEAKINVAAGKISEAGIKVDNFTRR